MPKIDKGETKKLLQGITANPTPEVSEPPTQEVKESTTSELEEFGTSAVEEEETQELPKWKTLEKVTALITPKQRDALDRVAKGAMRNRYRIPHKGRERITANTVLRALLEILADEIPTVEIPPLNNEDSVTDWIRLLFRKKA
jgi:hypothetical protein